MFEFIRSSVYAKLENENAALRAQVQRQAADIDYLAMMCGVELEKSEEEAEDE